MKKLLLPLLISLIVAGCFVNPKEENKKLISENELKEIVQPQMDEYGIPGVQVCVKNSFTGETTNLSLGYADMDLKTAMNNQTQIKIGSNTKSFTAIGVLLLVEKGLISLDDEIGKYLNIENENYKHITVHQLMNMHSGFIDYVNDDSTDFIIDKEINNPSYHFMPEELINYAFQLTDEHGKLSSEEFHYTNTNYVLLGMIIEKVSGKSYAEFIKNNILKPYRLNSTYIPGNNNFGSNVSSGYYFNKSDNTIENFSNLDLSYVWSAGGIISTASDLCTWMNLIGTNKILNKILIDLFTAVSRQDSKDNILQD